MKTFSEFMVIAEDKMTERLSKMSNDEFEQFLKGRTPGEAKSFRARRTKVPGSTFANNQKPQSPSSKGPITKPSSTPPKGAPTGKSTAIVPRQSTELSTKVKPPVQQIKTNMNVPGGRKIPGLKSGGIISGLAGAADEKFKGSGNLRAGLRGLVTGTGAVLGGIAGGTAGTAVGGPVGTAIGSYGGQALGANIASKAFDVAAGANAKERAAMRQQKRQSQAGGALKGIGGKTTFDTKKGTMTTGSGKQQKTVQLAKTSVVTDPKTGKKEVGYLAYNNGRAVYKRPDTSNKTLKQTSSNPLERLGRTLFAGAYKEHDAKQKAAKLKQAAQSDIKRQQALGVKGSKNLVGPKIVGPKIVGPKKPAPTTPTKKPPNLPNIK